MNVSKLVEIYGPLSYYNSKNWSGHKSKCFF